MYASAEIIYSSFKKAGPKRAPLSLGLALPFQPSMQDESTIQNILKNAEESLYIMFSKVLEPGCADDMVARLKNVFHKLNYNSHCKSIAVLIRPNEDKVTYLNFSVKPVMYLNKYVSLLELTANGERQPHFYYLVLDQCHARLFEYYQNQLHQVYATKQDRGQNEKPYSETLVKRISQTIARINGNNEKPVFITGSDNMAEPFCHSSSNPVIYFRLLNKVAPCDEEKINLLVKETIRRWNHWQLKFITDRIMITKKSNDLVAEIEAVLLALRNAVDGLLLIDKHLQQQLYKSRPANALFNTADELMKQVELFLIRGNRIEITEIGLLKEFGNIVLLQNKADHIFTFSPVNNTLEHNETDTF